MFFDCPGDEVTIVVGPIAMEDLEGLLVFSCKNPALTGLVWLCVWMFRCEFANDFAKVDSGVIELDARTPLPS